MWLVVLAVTISPLWYISRSAGFVGLALLGVIGILGMITAGNFHFGRGSRFVAPEVHRSLSLLAIVILAIHVGAAVLDKYSRIGLKDVFIPFVSQYRPIWIGIGAIAVDLGIAVLVTSFLRIKMGYKSWKVVHWLTYPIFALSIVHGLGSGSDSPILLGKIVYLAVGGVLLAGILMRLSVAGSFSKARKTATLIAIIATTAVVVSWSIVGPFTPSWPVRAQGGLRQALLASDQVPVSTKNTQVASAPLTLPLGYSSQWEGKADESPANAQGQIAIRLLGVLSASKGSRLSVVLIGTPQDGGVLMASSVVEIASSTGAIAYKGSVSNLSGSTIVCNLTGANGSQVTLNISLNITSSNTFTGSVTTS